MPHPEGVARPMTAGISQGDSDPSTQLDPGILKYALQIQQAISSESSVVQANLKEFLDHRQFNQKPEAKQDRKSHGTEPILAFLASSTSDVFEPALETDLSQPMSHYFISSSHNTYLTGNQLYSDASVDGYMKVLKAGCRCVEIDVWDGRSSSNESIGEEVQGLRDRLQQLRSHDTEDVSHDDSSSEHRGFRERLHLKKSDLKLAKDTKDADEPMNTESEELQMPLPWKSSSEPSPEPRVLHGHTLTREIPFRQVCEAIRATAFTSSDLPIIVSLEVHCGLQQQAMMVEIMQKVWRDYLLDFTRFATGSEPQYDSAPLPSPDQLRKKILIKVKYTPPEKAVKAVEQGEKVDSESSEESDAAETETEAKDKRQKKKKMLDELSLLGVYTRSFHFKNFLQEEAKIPTHVFALSENKLSEAIGKNASALTEHNKKFFMRAYPKGVRFSSSNLNPIPIWRHGVQMVALNWQRCDKSMMLNEGMFGGTQGWVLKPESYRDTSTTLRSENDEYHDQTTDVTRTVAESSAKGKESRTISSTPVITRTGPEVTLEAAYLSLSIRFCATQNLPTPSGIDDHHFHPYFKCILHTEALPSQRHARSRSHSRSPSPKSHHNVSVGNESKQSAHERASTLLHDYAHHRGRSTYTKNLHLDSQPQAPPPTKAKPKCKSRTLTQRGLNPDFGGETLRFENVPVDQEAGYMTFVRFKLMHDISLHKDELAGWACIRLGRLRCGWGFVRLKNKNGEDTQGKLLVHVDYSLRFDAAAQN